MKKLTPNESTGGIYKGLHMSERAASIIVCVLAAALTLFIAIAILASV